VARADVDFTLANARIQANGSYGHATDALEVKLEAPDMAPIAKAFKRDFAGSLSAQARLVGTFAALAGRVSATGEKLRVPGGFGAATMSAQVEVSAQADGRVDGKVEVTGLTRVTAATVETLAERATVTLAGTRADHRATLDAQLPPERRDSVTVSSPSTVTSTAPPAPLQPRRLQVALAGGLVEPAATPTWKGRIESFVLSGPNPLRLTGPAPLTLSRELVEVSEALVRGEIGAARFALTRWTPTRIEARGSSNGLLTRSIFRALGLSGQARSNLVLAADWDVRAAETLDGFVRVKRVEGDVRVGEPPISLGIEEFTLSLEATRGQVRAALALRGKQLGRIEARGATQVRKEGAAWGLTANVPLEGDIDADVPSLAWASDWLGPDARLDGRLRAKVALGGTLASPTYRGTLTADGVLLRDATAGFEIDEGRAALALNEREVVIERFELVSAWRPPSGSEQALARVKVPPKGTISAEGRLDFGSRTGSITVKAEGYPVSQLPARFLAATGEAKLETREGGLALSGAFKADAGYFSLGEAASPRVSEDVLIDRGEGVEEKKAQKIALDVRFNLGDHLHFAGRGLATRLGGELRVRGDPDRTLVASGQIRTVGGTYDAYGQKLAIERGVLAFQGPLDNPQLNVLAVREGLPVVAGVEILGSVGRPQVRLFSRPDVPDPEKLTWLVLGRGPGEASEGDTATLFAAANALLGANVENRKLFRQLGFDDVGFGRGGQSALGAMPQSSVAGRTGSTSGAEVFTVGKRLSRNLYVSYQHGLADAQATVRFAYTVSRRLQLLLIAGDKPGVDAVYRFTFE
jgi:translocation and assembly module TamB